MLDTLKGQKYQTNASIQQLFVEVRVIGDSLALPDNLACGKPPIRRSLNIHYCDHNREWEVCMQSRKVIGEGEDVADNPH